MADPETRHVKLMVVAGCPKVYFEGGTVNPDKAPAAQSRPAAEVWGPMLWRELHTKTDATPEYVASFRSRIPCGDCRKGWDVLQERFPPVYGEGWFEWTWRAHEAVNAHLGKPQVPLDDARRIWSR
jgi:hypothetical protein